MAVDKGQWKWHDGDDNVRGCLEVAMKVSSNDGDEMANKMTLVEGPRQWLNAIGCWRWQWWRMLCGDNGEGCQPMAMVQIVECRAILKHFKPILSPPPNPLNIGWDPNLRMGNFDHFPPENLNQTRNVYKIPPMPKEESHMPKKRNLQFILVFIQKTQCTYTFHNSLQRTVYINPTVESSNIIIMIM